MTSKIKIGDKEVALEANGATPVWYTQAFGADFFQLTEDAASGTAAVSAIEAWSRCAYIMAMQAEKADMTKLSITSYAVWLEDFGPTDLANAVSDVIDVWHGTAKTTAKPKK